MAHRVDPLVAGRHVGEHGLVRHVERRVVVALLRLGPAPAERQPDRQRQPGRRRRPHPPAAEPPGDQQRRRDVERQQRQRQRDQPRPEPDLRRLLERLHHHPLGHRPERRQPVVGAHHVQGHPALAAGVDPGRGLGRGPRRRQHLARHPGDQARRLELAEARDHLLRRPDRALERRVVGDPAGALGQPLEHLHEEPGERQARPVGAGGDVEQHHPPVAERLAGDERRAVLERRQHPLGQVGVGLRHHLARDVDVERHREPGERPVLRERLQPPRRAPGHRPADRAPAGPEPHRQQRVLLELPGSRRRQPRPGEAHEQPALLDPGHQRLALGVTEAADVGEDQHVGRGVQHLVERRLDQLGEGLERLPEVVHRVGQLLRLVAGPPRHQPDLATPERVVGEHHPRRRAPVRELHPLHPVPELDRQVERELGGALARRELGGRRPEHPLDAVRVRPERHHPDGARRLGRRPERRQPHLARLEPRRRQRQRALRRADERHRPAREQRPRQRRLRRRCRCRRRATASRSPRRSPRTRRPRRRGPAPRAAAPPRPAARSTRPPPATAAPRARPAAPPSSPPPPAGRRARRRRAPRPRAASAAASPARRPSRRR